MYETHFGFRRRPFRPTPDVDSYYPATGHEYVLTRLLQAVADDEGLALLTGGVGTGKTLAGHLLLERLGDSACTALVTNSHLADRAGLFQALLYDLNLPYQGPSEQELRLALTDFLLKNFAGGRRTVAVIDEAQHLTPDLLEELRLLGNLEARGGKAFQAVLVGQPALTETLRRPELAALSQRLVVRARLEPLGLEESADYLLHQLRAAGAHPAAVCSDEAVEILAAGARGLPRLLNQAAHQALLLAHGAGAPMVDAEAALEALAVLDLGEQPLTAEPEGCAGEAEGEACGPAEARLAPAGETEDRANDVLLTGPQDAAPSCRLFEAPRRPA